MTPLELGLLIILIICLLATGGGYRIGAISGQIASVLWLVLIALAVIWLFRALGGTL